MPKTKKDQKQPPHEKPVKIPLTFKEALRGLLKTTPKDLERAEKEYQASKKTS